LYVGVDGKCHGVSSVKCIVGLPCPMLRVGMLKRRNLCGG
jgi:hypothetical protein